MRRDRDGPNVHRIDVVDLHGELIQEIMPCPKLHHPLNSLVRHQALPRLPFFGQIVLFHLLSATRPPPSIFPRFNQRAKGRLSPLVAFFFLLLFFPHPLGGNAAMTANRHTGSPGR